MVPNPSDRHHGTRHAGGAEEKANDSRHIRNKSGGVDSHDRHAMQPSSRASPQHSSSRSIRNSQHPRRSESRSRSPWRPNRDRSRSPFRARRSPSRSRSRSRSPYRRDRIRDRSPLGRGDFRGEKRGRDEDHYTRGGSDPRRFKTYYEKDVTSTSMSAYAARDSTKYAHDKDTKFRSLPSQGGRTPRFVKAENQVKGEHAGADHDRGVPRSTNGLSNTLEAHSISKATINSDEVLRKDDGIKTRTEAGVRADHDVEPSTQSEAEIIEERRKRRAEIKARILREEAEKRAKQESALTDKAITLTNVTDEQDAAPVQHPIVQALKDSSLNSAPPSPLNDSFPALDQASSASASMPTTPLRDSTPTSPARIANIDPTDLTNHQRIDWGVDDDEGPSAADYDPKKDMEEDQRRQNRAENHTDSTSQSAKLNANDMFAQEDHDNDNDDDDEDDMFAPGFAIGKSTKLDKPVDASMVEDLPDGHYRVVLGELLDHRYNIRQQIGKGMFGTVVRAEDVKTGQLVAIKIARNNDAMYKAGQQEIDMLQILNESDPDDKRHIIRLKGDFMHKKHLCLVFENLGSDLRETLKKYGRNRGINLTAIRSYAQQMFLALSHLKKCDVLHADMKPDNILVSESRGLIKICDLGTAVKADHFLESTPYLISRFYRAPEVILGIPFDFAIDMWSVGCTLFELYTGRILFTGADNNGMLRMIQECRGKIPIRLLKKSREVDRHFDSNANFISTEIDSNTGKPMLRILPMNKTLPDKELRSRLSSHMKHLSPEQQKEHMLFLDLMERCLQIDPAKRISPNDALRHPFVAASITVRGSH